MTTLENAIQFAVKAHAGQVDKGGQPYILHPLRVMLAVHTPQERMAAVLHDVIEDTPLTAEDLARQGIPQAVIEAVVVLTKQKGESRIAAAKRAARHPIARAVKIQDVKDNLNIDRIKNPSERDLARLQEYEQVLAFLLGAKVE